MGAHGSKQLLADLEKLRSNDPFTASLSYENSQLGDDGAKLLAKALNSNHVLRRLQLGGCNLTAVGLQTVCRSLYENRIVPSRIRKLELSTGKPTPEESLVNSTSKHSPQGNPVGDGGAVCLAHLLENSVSLHHLIVASCQVGDEGAVALAKALEKSTTLKSLDLSHNSISDIGVEQLGNALAKNKSLVGLSLWNNRLFHSGAEALANGLASNSTLQWLGLGCNHIGDEGTKAIAIALLSNATDSGLTWLGLGGNEITDRGVEHLAVALMAQRSSPKQQPLEDNSSNQPSLSEQVRTGGLRPILELGVTPSHVSLAVAVAEDSIPGDLSNNEDDVGSTYCIPLESLGLGGNKITSVGATTLADSLKSNTCLSSLGLADNRICDDGATALADLIRYTDTLRKLFLSGNNIQDDGGSTLIAALSQNTSIDGLYLAENPLGDPVAVRCKEVIGRHNHTLQVLDLHGTRISTPALTNLMEAMHKEGILKTLGCRCLPSSTLPPSQNMMEWKPANIYAPYKSVRQSVSATLVPSQRHTTLETLGSLPLPDESAQTLVVQQSKRRESISQYIKRKLSKSGGSRRGYRKEDSEDTSLLNSPHRLSLHSPPSIELVPLVEEDVSLSAQRDRHRTVMDSTRETSLDPELNDIPVTLNTEAKHRPKSATSRRTSSKHSSPSHTTAGDTTVERIGGITKQETSTSLSSPSHMSRDERPLKEQWCAGLRMRVGMLRMGGFLHSGYSAVLAAASTEDSQDFQAGSLPCNLAKNRPSAPLPPADTRVKLQLVLEEVGSDYINASFIGTPAYPKSYIVTQTPLSETVGDFWRLIWEQRVCVMVVLTTEEEAEQWWPDEGDTQHHSLVSNRGWATGPLIVKTDAVQVTLSNPDVITRTHSMFSSVDNETENVTSYHYTAWPKQSIAHSVSDVADMYSNVLNSRLSQAVSSPVLVVSQHGGGRAGCFCAVAIAHELMISPEVSLSFWDPDPNLLDQVTRCIRQCRPGLVETQQQFEHCHLLLEQIISSSSSTDKNKKKKKGGKKWNLFRRKQEEDDQRTSLLY